MVDELMLRDVKNILNKLEVVKTREDYSSIVSELGLPSNSTLEDIDIAIVAKFMSSEELELYKRYIAYKRASDLTNLVGIMDSLDNLTTSVFDLYDERKKNNGIISKINNVISTVDVALRDIPNIRVGTEYNKVKVSYKKYFDAYIKSGMDRATFVEGIESIERSSLITRKLKGRKLRQLKAGLVVHNVDSKAEIDLLYDEYISEREEYAAYLKELMATMMSKSKVLYEAGLLTMRSMYGKEVSVKTLETGLKVVDNSSKNEITPFDIAEAAFEYFRKIDEPEFDAEIFSKAFRDFLLHFYTSELSLLEKANNTSLSGIKKLFDKQRQMMTEMACYRESLDVPSVSIEKDEGDTFALVYANTRMNK